MKLRSLAGRGLLMLGAILVAWALAESTLLALLAHPKTLIKLPRGIYANVRALYFAVDRPIIQYRPECAQFDPGLLYTLRPGSCRFGAREFSTRYDINTLGVRDDPSRLKSPRAVVIGDSLAMGWGVEADQTFAKVLERKRGLPVLNTGVSSYGTVRELLMLERVDLSAATHLILQYSENDIWENTDFMNAGKLRSGGAEAYRSAVEEERTRTRYWPGRYTWWLLGKLFEGRAGAAPIDESSEAQARTFLFALEHAPTRPLDGLKLFVIEAQAPGFFVALEAELGRRKDLPAWIRDMTLVRMEQPDTYLLDDHWTAVGHRQAAEALDRAMFAPR